MGIRLHSSLPSKKFFSQTVLLVKKAASAPLNVPKGFFTVYVGETEEAFCGPNILIKPAFIPGFAKQI